MYTTFKQLKQGWIHLFKKKFNLRKCTYNCVIVKSTYMGGIVLSKIFIVLYEKDNFS